MTFVTLAPASLQTRAAALSTAHFEASGLHAAGAGLGPTLQGHDTHQIQKRIGPNWTIKMAKMGLAKVGLFPWVLAHQVDVFGSGSSEHKHEHGEVQPCQRAGSRSDRAGHGVREPSADDENSSFLFEERVQSSSAHVFGRNSVGVGPSR